MGLMILKFGHYIPYDSRVLYDVVGRSYLYHNQYPAQISIMTCECTSITQHAILCRFWHDFYFCSLSYKYFKSIILIYRGDPITDTRTFTFCTATNILSTFCKKELQAVLSAWSQGYIIYVNTTRRTYLCLPLVCQCLDIHYKQQCL